MELNDLLYNLGRGVGLLGFVCLSLLIVVGDTARFLDKFFGLDKIIKFERKFSIFTAVFVVLHPLFFILSFSSFKLFLIPDFTILPLAFGIISFYIFVFVGIASKKYKQISHAVWQYIHIITYLLFFFVLYHAKNWGSNSEDLLFKLTFQIAFWLVVSGIVYWTYYKTRQIFSDKFFVKQIKQETSDTYTLSLDSKSRFDFKPGQFCFLRLNKERLYARHPFSISSVAQDGGLDFTIKKQGRFTQIAEHLKEGEEVKVEGPFGKFTVQYSKKDIVLIAGGVGITPIFSIIKDNINKKNQKNILLLYGSRTMDDIIFKKQLDDINQDWFKKVYILSGEKQKSQEYERGYVDKDLILKYIKNFDSKLFYICGPEIMKNSVKQILKDLGVSKKDIFIEDFFW